ncbi:hypothetical protein AGMMS50230_08210 [Spirochaetia bacterium]|nr:hypothetical protein AGMMS50230_08210 [Spirochaetia bacterium]
MILLVMEKISQGDIMDSEFECLADKRLAPKNRAFSGKILVWGNMTRKKLFFEYRFDKERMVTNVIVTILVKGKEYDYPCYFLDCNNPVKSSESISPKFDITLPIQVIRISPQVT